MKIVSTSEQLRNERKKNAELQNALNKAQANIDYIAIMSDIDIDDEVEATNEQEL